MIGKRKFLISVELGKMLHDPLVPSVPVEIFLTGFKPLNLPILHDFFFFLLISSKLEGVLYITLSLSDLPHSDV